MCLLFLPLEVLVSGFQGPRAEFGLVWKNPQKGLTIDAQFDLYIGRSKTPKFSSIIFVCIGGGVKERCGAVLHRSQDN